MIEARRDRVNCLTCPRRAPHTSRVSDAPLGSVLIVDDDRALLAALEETLRPLAAEVHTCASRRSARAYLGDHIPDLLLLDLVLPDGDAFDVLALLERRYPLPRIVAMSGVASPEQSFRLAQLGVRAFLVKPFDSAELRAAVDEALRAQPDLQLHVRQVVGKRSLREVESEVRGTMLREALARGGSRRGASRLLGVSRQLVQHIIRKARGR